MTGQESFAMMCRLPEIAMQEVFAGIFEPNPQRTGRRSYACPLQGGQANSKNGTLKIHT